MGDGLWVVCGTVANDSGPKNSLDNNNSSKNHQVEMLTADELAMVFDGKIGYC